jgi:multidrug resistance efflux pump
MKKTILNLKDMSDIKEVYENRPDPSISHFIYVIAAVIAACLIYCCFGTIEIVATARGVIRPNDHISTVSSMTSGRIVQTSYENGQTVHKGDVLMKIDDSSYVISLNSLEAQLRKNQDSIAACQKFIRGIENHQNPFSSDPSSEEYTYYVQYQEFSLNQNTSANSIAYDAASTEEHIASLNQQIQDLLSQIDGLKKLRQSISEGIDYVSDLPEYETRYQSYLAAMASLENEYASKKESIASDVTADSQNLQLDTYKKNLIECTYLVDSIQNNASVFPEGDTSSYKAVFDNYIITYNQLAAQAQPEAAGGEEGDIMENTGDAPADAGQTAVSSPELDALKAKTLAQYLQEQETLQADIDALELSLSSAVDKDTQLQQLEDSYADSKNQQTQSSLANIDSALETAQSQLTTSQDSLKQYQLVQNLNLQDTSNGTPTKITLMELEKITQLQSNVETLEKQNQDLTTQIEQVRKSIEQCTICAEQDGVINVIQVMTAGDVISSGTTIATIIPENETEYKAELYVNNADISGIKEGDTVKYDISALPKNQYGLVTGTVMDISTDTLVQNGEYSGYYVVYSSIQKLELTDRDGNTGTVDVGMEVTAKIVTQKKTIIRYLLEKINFF